MNELEAKHERGEIQLGGLNDYDATDWAEAILRFVRVMRGEEEGRSSMKPSKISFAGHVLLRSAEEYIAYYSCESPSREMGPKDQRILLSGGGCSEVEDALVRLASDDNIDGVWVATRLGTLSLWRQEGGYRVGVSEEVPSYVELIGLPSAPMTT